MLSDLEHQLETASLASKKLNQDAKAKGLSRVGSSLRREFSAFRKVLENSKSRLQELEAMKADLESMDMREGPVPVLEPIEQDTTTLESTREPALELVAPEAAFESREPESNTPLPMTKAKSFNFRLRSSTRSAMTTLESTPEHGEPALKPVQMAKAKSFSRRLRSATQSVGKSVKSPHWLPSLGNKKKFFPEEESRVSGKFGVTLIAVCYQYILNANKHSLTLINICAPILFFSIVPGRCGDGTRNHG